MQTPNDFHSALDAWFAKCGATRVSFVPVFNPPVDPRDDYLVVYEAKFEPESLDRARLELWLTDDGYIAVGLETRERIAMRLGTRTLTKGFASGHEPGPVSQEAVLRLLDYVAAGEIAIRARVGIFGLRRTSAIASPEVGITLAEAGYAFPGWIRDLRSSSSGAMRFRAWNVD